MQREKHGLLVSRMRCSQAHAPHICAVRARARPARGPLPLRLQQHLWDARARIRASPAGPPLGTATSCAAASGVAAGPPRAPLPAEQRTQCQLRSQAAWYTACHAMAGRNAGCHGAACAHNAKHVTRLDPAPARERVKDDTRDALQRKLRHRTRVSACSACAPARPLSQRAFCGFALGSGGGTTSP